MVCRESHQISLIPPLIYPQYTFGIIVQSNTEESPNDAKAEGARQTMSDIEFETTIDVNGNDVDIFVNIDTEDVISSLENEGYMIYDDSSSLDELLGSIESTTIINHLESSINAMVIRMEEEPTDHLIGVFIEYLQREGYVGNLVSLMRRAGIPLEKIIRHYIDDALTEEKREGEMDGY